MADITAHANPLIVRIIVIDFADERNLLVGSLSPLLF